MPTKEEIEKACETTFFDIKTTRSDMEDAVDYIYFAYKEAIDALRAARDPHTAKWRLKKIDEILSKVPEDL